MTCLKGVDDRVETPEGVHVNIHDQNHPILKDIPWNECPVFEGFNRIFPKEELSVLATIGEGEDKSTSRCVGIRKRTSYGIFH